MRYVLYETPIYLSLYKHNEDLTIFESFPIHHGFELFYVHEIEAELKVAVGPRIYSVKPGDFILIKPNQYHRIMAEKPRYYLRSMIKFDHSSIRDLLDPFPSITRVFDQVLNNNLERQVIHIDHQEQIAAFCQYWKQRLQVIPKHELLEEKKLFLLTAFRFLKSYIQSMVPDLEITEETPVEQVMSWINRNYAKKITLTNLANIVHLSPSYLSKMFHEQTGVTITEYTTITRIRHACILLKETSLPVKEIGERVGIGNYSYFCSLFRKKLAVSPLQYRRDTVGLFPGI